MTEFENLAVDTKTVREFKNFVLEKTGKIRGSLADEVKAALENHMRWQNLGKQHLDLLYEAMRLSPDGDLNFLLSMDMEQLQGYIGELQRQTGKIAEKYYSNRGGNHEG